MKPFGEENIACVYVIKGSSSYIKHSQQDLLHELVQI